MLVAFASAPASYFSAPHRLSRPRPRHAAHARQHQPVVPTFRSSLALSLRSKLEVISQELGQVFEFEAVAVPQAIISFAGIGAPGHVLESASIASFGNLPLQPSAGVATHLVFGAAASNAAGSSEGKSSKKPVQGWTAWPRNAGTRSSQAQVP